MMDDAEKLGCRSPLVLMKLGHDLRPTYDTVLTEPLPAGLLAIAEELDGYADWEPTDTDPAG